MKRLFLGLLGIATVGLMFGQTTPTKSTESPCNRHYETAIKFIVDTPVAHPFTVDANGARVLFSSGNLQYCANYSEIQDGVKRSIHNAWRFAPRQFDFVGDAGAATVGATPVVGGNVYYDSIVNTGTKSLVVSTRDSLEYASKLCDNNQRGSGYQGWIDLLPWASSCQGSKVHDPLTKHFSPSDLINMNEVVNGLHNQYGVGPSLDLPNDSLCVGALNETFDKVSGANRYFDWGFGNGIREFRRCTRLVAEDSVEHYRDSTMYRPGVWRTLTSAEWKYILENRKLLEDNAQLAWSCVSITDTLTINGTNPTITGIVLYPDDFSFTEVGLSLIATGKAGAFTPTTLAMDEWELLELAGCIFLPSAYYYNSTTREVKNDISTTPGTPNVCSVMCCYWSSTNTTTAAAPAGIAAHSLAMCLDVTLDATPAAVATAEGTMPRPDGRAVRLVQDFVPKGL